jgi:hypothetical protein
MLNPIVIGGPEGGSARTVPTVTTKTATTDAPHCVTSRTSSLPNNHHIVIPAKAGIQAPGLTLSLDPRFRAGDE